MGSVPGRPLIASVSSVDQGGHVIVKDFLDERCGTGNPYAVEQIPCSKPTSTGALRAHRNRPVGEHGSEQVRGRRRLGKLLGVGTAGDSQPRCFGGEPQRYGCTAGGRGCGNREPGRHDFPRLRPVRELDDQTT